MSAGKRQSEEPLEMEQFVAGPKVEAPARAGHYVLAAIAPHVPAWAAAVTDLARQATGPVYGNLNTPPNGYENWYH